MMIFDTQIAKEKRKENVSLKGEASVQLYARSSIDNVNARITTEVGQTNENLNILSSMVDNQGNEIDALGTRLTQTVSDITATVTSIQEEIDGSATSVKTTSVTIDDEGLSVLTGDSSIKTTMDNDSFEIRDRSNTPLVYIGYNEQERTSKAQMDNLTVTHYFVAGVHRIEKIPNENRTGFFYIGG